MVRLDSRLSGQNGQQADDQTGQEAEWAEGTGG